MPNKWNKEKTTGHGNASGLGEDTTFLSGLQLVYY